MAYPIHGIHALRRLLLATATLLLCFFTVSSCGSSDSSSSSSQEHAVSGSVLVPQAASGLVTADVTVNFTIRWSENAQGDITGEYVDDYFAKTAQALSGKVDADGTRSFVITLASPVGEVVTLTVTMPEITADHLASGSIKLSSFAGLSAAQAVIFDRNDVSVSVVPGASLPGTGSSPSPAPAGAEAQRALFTKIKNTYEWYAQNATAPNQMTDKLYADETFVHGTLYKFTISDQAAGELTDEQKAKVWGSVTIEGGGKTVIFNYGTEASDKFENVEYEEYASILRDNVNVLVMHKLQPTEDVFMSFVPNDAVNYAAWSFVKTAPEALVAPKTGLAKYGAEYLVGTHTFKVTSTKCGTLYEKDDELEVTVTADGGVTAAGKFGTYSAAAIGPQTNGITNEWCKEAGKCSSQDEMFWLVGKYTQGKLGISSGGYRNNSDGISSCYFNYVSSEE